MRLSSKLIASVTVLGLKVTSAAPLTARAAPVVNDGIILNYALTLEHLENAFYSQALQKFEKKDFNDAGFSDGFYDQVRIISNDEATHVDFLEKGLTAAGAVPVKPCTYKFPLETVEQFAIVSGILEGVGVSAYLGAAATIIDRSYLTAAGSILTVEARHSSFIRNANKQAPFPQPFDTPLTFNEVFSLAVQFILQCPSDNPPLPFVAFPTLAVVPSEGDPEIKSGNTITLSVAAGPSTDKYIDPSCVWAAFITVTGPVFAKATPSHEGTYTVVVPEGINGQSYVVLTASNTEVTDDNTIAGPAVIEITNY